METTHNEETVSNRSKSRSIDEIFNWDEFKEIAKTFELSPKDFVDGEYKRAGKFQGERPAAFFFYHWMLNGDGETLEDNYTLFQSFTDEERSYFGFRKDTVAVAVHEIEAGFIALYEFNARELRDFRALD